MSSLSEKSAFEAFARMEERIEQNERQLKASVEIDEEFTGDQLANQFKQLERGAASTSVDMRLIELKQKMGILPPPSAAQAQRQIGGGNAKHDEETVHAEIDEDIESEKKGS